MRRPGWKQGLVVVAGVMHVTERCNLECRHCYRCSSRDAPREMNFTEFMRALDAMAGTGISQLVLTGGEPLLHRDFARMVVESSRRGFKVKVNTNGTLIRERVLGKLGPEALFEVRVSLDGGREEHDDVRGTGQYRKTVSALAELTRRGYVATTATVRGVASASSVARALAASSEHGVAHMHVYGFVQAGRARDLPQRDDGRENHASTPPRSSAPDTPATRPGVLDSLERVSVAPCRWSRVGFCYVSPDGRSRLIEAGGMHRHPGGTEEPDAGTEVILARHLSRGGKIYDCRGCEHRGHLTCWMMHDHCIEDWRVSHPFASPVVRTA